MIIQFAHNDEKNGGMDGYQLKAYYERIGDTEAAAAVDLRGSVPPTTYKDNLRQLAEAVRQVGAYPIFVSSACRSYFTGTTIRRNGRHDLGDSFSVLTDNGPTTGNKVSADNHSMDYPYQMKMLAEEMDVPFIDLTTATKELYERYEKEGAGKCNQALFDGQGSTHFNATGALLVAQRCAQLMKEQGILADAIDVPTDLTVTPATADMGEAYTGQTLQKEFIINGFNLKPAEGIVSVTATTGIRFSIDKKTWQDELRVDYKDNTLVQKFYAQVKLTASGAFAGTITVSQGDKQTDIPVTAFGKAMDVDDAVNEQDYMLTWPLKDGANSATTAVASKGELFSVAEMSVGDKLVMNGTRTDGGICETMFQPTEQASAQEDGNAITFTLKPKKGLTFTPKRFAFHASRVGTNGGNFDVVATMANGTAIVLAKDERPQLVKESPYFTAYDYDLSIVGTTDDVLALKIYIRGLATNKQYAFSDVVVTGDVVGQIETVPVYTLNVSLGTKNAGKVSTNPAGSEFDEGTHITVTATENFGYHFAAWVDGDGEIVSTDNPYDFEISGNTVLVATYTKNNVYALNLTRSEGVNDNLVQYAPMGNVVDGVHYYEEGTNVKLTAVNNRILTFIGWAGDAQGTSQEYELKMDGEKNITANFSAADYIVGWDLYYDQPAKDRAADYKADTENAGMLSLRKADGTTNGWLTRGIGNGQENGKYAARIWKYLSEEWYFEISFSSKGYENLSVSSCIGDDYNTYSVNNVEYSVDGETFTKIGEFNPPARGWDGPKEFSLPAAANDQQRVWIRWMPDRTSTKVGVESDYDGTSIAEIFVLADAMGGAAQKATLVSSTPVEGATDVSASGSIILNFDSKVKAGTGTATLKATVLDGFAVEEISPIISGKSAIFKYSGLKYGTDYTFSMPEGTLVSRSGNPVDAATISFTTMERRQPEMRLYDAIVDASATSASTPNGISTYPSVQAAIDAAPTGSAKPWLIFIKNGRYKEHVDIPKTKPYIHLIGQDRDKTVILDDRMAGGANAQHVSVAATVVVNANNCFFENLTMENSYGHEQQAGPQALALNTIGDRIAMNNVALLSYQDTWITTSTSNNRHYIKNSLIEGAVDFIYNSGNVYLDGDTLEINRPSGGYIVAPSHAADVKWGYVFQNNILRAHPGVNVTDVWLGRPWHNQPKTVFINLKTYINIPAKGWYNTMGGLPVLWADYNTVDANGNPLDLSQRENYYYYTNDAGTKVEAFNVKNYLTDEEAAQYTIKNVCGGDDDWQPDLMCEACNVPEVSYEGGKLSWNAVPYAICYVVTLDDEVVAFTTDCEYTPETAAALRRAAVNSSDFKVQAVNEYGGLSQKGQAGGNPTAVSRPATAPHAQAVYTVGGRQLSTPRRGINIVRMDDGTIQKYVVM